MTYQSHPKKAKIEDRKYLNWLHTQPCIITGLLGSEYETIDPAHLGTRRTHGDDEVLPVLHRFHGNGHQHSEARMWREHLPDYVLIEALRALAREMYRKYRMENGI